MLNRLESTVFDHFLDLLIEAYSYLRFWRQHIYIYTVRMPVYSTLFAFLFEYLCESTNRF